MMDLEKFRSAGHERRTARVAVPALSAFFPDGATAEMVVQGLSGPEVFRAEERRERNAAIDELLSKMAGDRSDKIDAVLSAMGINSADVPARLVKAIAFVEYGTVEPRLTQADAVRLAECHIDTFIALYRKIDQLTALGYVSSGESSASGQPSECETPSPSAPEACTGTDSSSK